MKYILTFNEKINIWNPELAKFLPNEIKIFKGQEPGIDSIVYKRGNIMLHSDMVQITYYSDVWGEPDNLEFDLYFVKEESGENRVDLTHIVKNHEVIGQESGGNGFISNLKIDVDITFGEQMACEFTLAKSGVSLTQHTSYGSKYDRTNTIFAIDDISLSKLIDFFNRFNIGVSFSIEDFYFLRISK